MVEPCAYLFLGSDEIRKHQKLELLTRGLFPANLKELNVTLLYGDDKGMSAAALQEILQLLPTEGAQKRLVVVRMAHRMNPSVRRALIGQLKKGLLQTLVVVDIPEAKDHEELVKEFVSAGVEVVRFKESAALNVFDLGRSIAEHKADRSLKILSELLASREKPEKLLGGLFWQWEKFLGDKKIAPDIYARGVKLICDADRRLKSSVSACARDHLILESLVVKLSLLA